jgi:hypothetical protein
MTLVMRRWFGFVWLRVLDLRVDGAAIDRAAALLALDDPGCGQRQIQTDHARNHRRIKGEYHLTPGAHAAPSFLPVRVSRDGFVPLIN